jgi:solute carrier family 25 carnitine/acylcarnitine transporter 20/29
MTDRLIVAAPVNAPGVALPQGLPSKEQLSFSDLLLAGGLGGTAFWLGCYPLDVIKSKLQVDSYSSPRYRGILDCGRQVVAAEGMKGLFRGFVPALARSFPANAVCFAVYEATKSLVNTSIS